VISDCDGAGMFLRLRKLCISKATVVYSHHAATACIMHHAACTITTCTCMHALFPFLSLLPSLFFYFFFCVGFVCACYGACSCCCFVCCVVCCVWVLCGLRARVCGVFVCAFVFGVVRVCVLVHPGQWTMNIVAHKSQQNAHSARLLHVLRSNLRAGFSHA
jgi:hypothetical protein